MLIAKIIEIMTGSPESRNQPQPERVEPLQPHISYDLLFVKRRDHILETEPMKSGSAFISEPTAVINALQEAAGSGIVILGVRETTKRRFNVFEAEEPILVEELQENARSRNFWVSYQDKPARLISLDLAGQTRVGELTLLDIAQQVNEGKIPAKVVVTNNDDVFPANRNDEIVEIDSPRNVPVSIRH